MSFKRIDNVESKYFADLGNCFGDYYFHFCKKVKSWILDGLENGCASRFKYCLEQSISKIQNMALHFLYFSIHQHSMLYFDKTLNVIFVIY